jgi:hypothetical protein
MASFVGLTDSVRNGNQVIFGAPRISIQRARRFLVSTLAFMGVFLSSPMSYAAESNYQASEPAFHHQDEMEISATPLEAETEATVSCDSLNNVFEDPTEVVLENGTIGILKVKAIIDVSRSQYQSSFALIVDDGDFDKLMKINKICQSMVLVSLSKPHRLTFSLVKANFQDRRILGRVKSKLEKIWILPERYAQDLSQHYRF